ncbi:hypothetical protein [Pedobacter caeni]|uniref:Uncharacterized protein n=1 Tax=Pedobacter caeni TaxID=288992 RepID=A0A1M4W9C5_9SPHI|nr:hypothetical protein [Pedobacter caeni]SHE77807.1 hypothetical protein SAMN04488522_1011185 [Pedobacter caeni]
MKQRLDYKLFIHSNGKMVRLSFCIIMLLFTAYSPVIAQKKVTKGKYFLAVNFSIPFEVLVNDLVLVKGGVDGLAAAENLDAFLTTDGRQKIKIRVFAPNMEKGGVISPKLLKSLKGAVYQRDSSKEKLLLSLDFSGQQTARPSFEQEWTFDHHSELNYGSLKNAVNLNRMDKQELQKMVLSRFNELRAILNAGDGTTFMKIIDKAKHDLFAAERMSVAEQKAYNENLMGYFDAHKGIMPEIKNYQLRIMGNGKAVTLENATAPKGLGVLTAEDKKDNSRYQNYFILQLPQHGKQFEVFKYSLSYTGLD